jgi:LytR cell envelope-related transcriptional attenuator
MTSPGQYAAPDGSFGRSAGGAAGRGLVLIAIAIVVGLILLAKGFDGADSTLAASPAGEPSVADEPAAADDPTTTDGTDTESETPTDGTVEPTDSVAPETTHPPAEVKVAAVNATGAPGVAGRATGVLDTNSYVTQAKNATTNTEVSAVYYTAGYAEDAKAVAAALGIPPDLIGAAPPNVLDLIKDSDNVADFNVFIFQGSDGQAGT